MDDAPKLPRLQLHRLCDKHGISMQMRDGGPYPTPEQLRKFAADYGRACYIAGLQEAAEICCPTNKRAEQHTSISGACARDIEARIAQIKEGK